MRSEADTRIRGPGQIPKACIGTRSEVRGAQRRKGRVPNFCVAILVAVLVVVAVGFSPTAQAQMSFDGGGVNGGWMRPGDSSDACAAGIAGAIRYRAGAVEYCNGTAWALIGGGGGGTTGSQNNGVATTGVNFVVPDGVTTITVRAWGAGGGGTARYGGGGGFAQADLTVTPGETLTIKVGGGGKVDGGTPGQNAPGGGGYSGLFRGGTPLIIAGGGGGGPGNGDGGPGGGASGGTGTDTGVPTAGGRGGTAAAGGAAGTGLDSNATAGASLQGGAGGGGNKSWGSTGGVNGGGAGGGQDSPRSYGGGGGGGGYFGGGGGDGGPTNTAGGGGGSSYTTGINTIKTSGSGASAGNNADGICNGAGQGGSGANGVAGTDGRVYISWSGGGGGGGSSQWVDGASGAIYYSGGNVGIGTAAPSTLLSLGPGENGAYAKKFLLLDIPASKAYSGWGHVSYEDRLFFPSDGHMSFGTISMTDGTTWAEKVRIQNDGNVGIGTAAPSHKLSIGHTEFQQIDPVTTDTDKFVTIATYKSATQQWGLGQNVGLQIIAEGSTAGSNGNIQFLTGNGAIGSAAQERMRILNNGNVGIGTASPQARLDIGNGGMIANGASYIWGIKDGAFVFDQGSSNPSGFNLKVGANSGLFIDSSGNVGIGTAAPANKLHVAGGATTEPTLQIGETSGAVGRVIGRASDVLIGTFSNHPLSIRTNSLSRIDIDASGNVGIGTTAPDGLLHLRKGGADAVLALESTGGFGRVFKLVQPNAGGFAIRNETASRDDLFINNSGNVSIGTTANVGPTRLQVRAATSDNSAYAIYVDNSTGGNELLAILGDGSFGTGSGPASPKNNTTSSAANVYINNGVLQRSTSSARYKTDIRPMTDWRWLLAVRPVTFNNKKETDGRRYGGLLAEDIAFRGPKNAAGIPLFAGLDPSGRPDDVAYQHLTAPIILGLQDHERRVKKLDLENLALKATVRSLDAENDELKAENAAARKEARAVQLEVEKLVARIKALEEKVH